ncbi:Gastrula zinc finger protein, partial [Taenia solium]
VGSVLRPYVGEIVPLEGLSDKELKIVNTWSDFDQPGYELLTYYGGKCKERFKRKETLKNHIETHTGLKPYPCSDCGKSFAYPSSLRTHVTTVHKGELVHFWLSAYGITFLTYLFHSIQKHNSMECVHLGLSPHSCSDCGKAFSCRSHLRLHVTAKHSVKAVTVGIGYQCKCQIDNLYI